MSHHETGFVASQFARRHWRLCSWRPTSHLSSDIGVFKSGQTEMCNNNKCFKESANLIESCKFAFDTYDWKDFP